MPKPTYIGRFAPSPSGPLHLGSLFTAVASYLDAKSQSGKWHLRIEDIDPPREQIGASKNIIQSLIAHGLLWDEDIIYQSQQTNLYQSALEQLKLRGKAYPCSCTRKHLITLNGFYDRHCILEPPQQSQASAMRFFASSAAPEFVDRLQGQWRTPQPENLFDDFIIKRKDNLWAYQLAVVVDDIFSNVTDIVRGIDIIDSTGKQLLLYDALEGETDWQVEKPRYLHLPVLIDANRNKLSKQNHAAAIDNSKAYENVLQVLALLGQELPQQPLEDVQSLLTFAIERFDTQNIPKEQQLSL